MSIFEDARNGVLGGAKLDDYLANNPNILGEQDPESGLTPLAIAVVEGFPEEVRQLLEKGAKADVLSRDDETPLLLAAWKAVKERPLIIQLLLEKTPPSIVDKTSRAAGNKTPLMFAIEKRDIDSIKMLRRAKASLTIKSDEGFNAKEMAENMARKDIRDGPVYRALDPDREQMTLARIAGTVVSLLLYIVAWINSTLNGVVRRATGLNPALDPTTHQRVVGTGQQPTKDEFVEKVDEYVRGGPLERFFKDKKDFIQDVARKAANLEKDESTDLGKKDLLPKTIKVSLHKQVIYCDDSSSMHRAGRWDGQKGLVMRIARITTQILPDGEGVALCFINQDIGNSANMTSQEIVSRMDSLSWDPNGNTPIGTNLKTKVLQPLVYDEIGAGKLDRPLLISIMTDGMPSNESENELATTILECGRKLEAAGYSADCVKFMIGQIGTAGGAASFLESLRSNADIAPVAFITSDKLDSKFTEFHANERELDRWLIETLFTPLTGTETKKDL
ncbi:hypothetical protein MKZ38_002291 [Zalerion maritima]|uniref:Ankyrin n=1 Tax=Zalerion maritima TaxID=339359 RepID=A0AAD5RQM8_9PEZI|nr:hypothetical protein MKZ38_002291 [Zalerion maritima]